MSAFSSHPWFLQFAEILLFLLYGNKVYGDFRRYNFQSVGWPEMGTVTPEVPSVTWGLDCRGRKREAGDFILISELNSVRHFSSWFPPWSRCEADVGGEMGESGLTAWASPPSASLVTPRWVPNPGLAPGWPTSLGVRGADDFFLFTF